MCTVAQLYSHNGIKHFAERLGSPAGVVFVCTLLSDLIQNYEITAFFYSRLNLVLELKKKNPLGHL